MEGIERLSDVPKELINEISQIVKASTSESAKREKINVIVTFAKNIVNRVSPNVASIIFKDNKL